MKFAGMILRVLAVVLAVGTLVAFFFPFVEVAVSPDKTATLNGLECVFGGDLSDLYGIDGMITFKGGYFFGAFVLVALTAVSMVLGLVSKKKGWNGAALVTGVLASILLVVFYTNHPIDYVDMGRLVFSRFSYTLSYTPIMLAAMIGSIASVVVCTAGVLVHDAVVCKETGELTIPQKVFKFLREYKSELKKVVWPAPRSVFKNTLVVLGFCAVALVLIWLMDWGLGELFDLCFRKNG